MNAGHFASVLSMCGLLLVASLATADDATAPANKPQLRAEIDRYVAEAWAKQSITPADGASDEEFVRRVYLDLLGRIPKYEETLAFLDNAAADKREKLIEQLLAQPRFGVHQSDVWDMIYFGRNPPGYDTDKRDGFQTWLADQFNKNVPYDKWAGDILRAEGNTVEQGAPMFYVQYKNQPEDATEAITQKFLGVQLQCARCHDHPFEKWTQMEFYGMAAFVARLQVVDSGMKGKLKSYAIGEKNTGDVLFTGPAAQQVPGKKGEPVKPKFLGGAPLEEPEPPKDLKEANFPNGKEPPPPKFSRKDALAAWITSPENPYFARAAVNRLWAQFMGKGLVHPIDNLSPKNPASHPELLDLLTDEFKAHQFDVKWLLTELLNSRTYQLSSRSPVPDTHPAWFERAAYRPLSAEELFESWLEAVGYHDMLAANKEELKERFQAQGITWDYIRRFFGRPNDGVGNFQGGLHEHLYLNNGQVHQLITERKGSLYDTLSQASTPWETRVERLYLQTLSRRPTPEETQRFVAHLSASDDPRGRLHEAIWTLITCSEFRFNH